MQCYIGDIVHMSTSSWPGRIATVVMLAGCDFHCPGCKSAHINEFSEAFLRDLKDIKKEVKANSGFSKAVVFSGGEPCLQREALLSLAKYCKSLGLSVGIETNGSRPLVLDMLLTKGMLDFIALDIKSPLVPDAFRKATNAETFFTKSHEVIESLTASISVLRAHQAVKPDLQIEIRTTIIPGIVYKKEHISSIAHFVKGLDCTYRLQAFKPEFSKGMSAIRPPSQEFMSILKAHLEKSHPELRIA